MDSDGVELISLEESDVHFDLNENGFAELTGWVQPDDALLSWDRNGDGKINDNNELFGSATEDGFSQLNELDTNQDGRIDSADDDFDKLTLWQDKNTDGITDEGELISLTDAGISFIDLNADEISETNQGHDVSHRSTVAWVDGSSSVIEDIWFQNDQTYTNLLVPEGFVYDELAFILPQLKGYGNVGDLAYAISLDSDLKQEVVQLVNLANTGDVAQFLEKFEQFLFNWTGVSDIDPNSRGPSIDAQHLAVIEAFQGGEYNQGNYYGATPGPVWGVELEDHYQSVVESLALRFLVQAPQSTIKFYFHQPIERSDEQVATDLIAFIASNPLIAVMGIEYLDVSDLLSFNAEDLTSLVENLFSRVDNSDYSGITAVLSLFRHEYAQTDEYKQYFEQAISDGLSNAGKDDSFIDSVLTEIYVEDSQAISGTSGDDILQGGISSDLLEGGAGNDTYVWGSGQGNDVTNEEGSSSDSDVLLLQGLNPDDIYVYRMGPGGEDIHIVIKATGEQLSLDDQLAGSSKSIETIQFENGTVWTAEDLRENSEVFAMAGDEVIEAYGGYAHGDAYVWNSGSGNDILKDTSSSSYTDRVRLKELNESDLSYARDGNSLVMTIVATGETLTIENQFRNKADGIEYLSFADGKELDRQQIQMLAPIQGTDGDDALEGSYSHEAFDAGAGNDTLTGGSGSDTYFWGTGRGSDTVIETKSSGTDKIKLIGFTENDLGLSRQNDDLILTLSETGQTLNVKDHFDGDSYGVEGILFEDGTEWDASTLSGKYYQTLSSDGDDVIDGSEKSEVLSGGLGDDQLGGDGGSDSYIYSLGDGSDVITDRDYSTSSIDKLVLHNVFANQLTFSRGSSSSLIITMPDGGSVTINKQFYDQYSGIEEIHFDDGTILDRTEIQDRYLSDMSSDGDDVIDGSYSSDTITGGLGNDQLDGYDGSDSYIYSLGDGSDVITDRDYSTSSIDKLVLHNVFADQLTFSRGSSSSLIITMPDGGSVTINKQFYDQYSGIEEIHFDDGTILDRTEILDRYLSDMSSDGDDVIDGSYSSDTITGGLGNDQLDGYDGSDSYIYSLGDGSDVITDRDYSTSSIDKLVLHNVFADQLTFSRGSSSSLIITMPDGGSVTINKQFYDQYSGIEEIHFDDGTILDRTEILDRYLSDMSSDGDDVIDGSYSSDTITGGLGNDQLDGYDGSDSYIYSLGDGSDVITDRDYSTSSIDKLVLHNVFADQLTFSRGSSSSLIITMPDGGSVTINKQFYDQYSGIEEIHFDDGTILDRTEILDRYLSDMSSDGDDVIDGSYSSDTITGGLGNDQLDGYDGSDSYIYSLGDGSDVITDRDYSTSSIDKLVLRGVAATEVVAIQGENSSLVLSMPDGGTVTINKQFYDQYSGIEEIYFDDGTVWTRDQIDTKIASGAKEFDDSSSGTYVIGGDAKADIFVIDAVSTDYSWARLDDGTGIYVWQHGEYDNHDILWDMEFLQFNDATYSLSGGYQERVIAQDDPNITEYPGGTAGVADVYVVSGNSSDFNWAHLDEGPGLYVWQHGNYGNHDVIFDFERIQFNDTEIVLAGGFEERIINFDDSTSSDYSVGSAGFHDVHVIAGNSSEYSWEWTYVHNGFDVWLGDDYDNRDVLFDIETIQFADRTIALAHHGDGSSEIVRGNSGDYDEAIIGHAGNDDLYGGQGDDVFVFAASDGNDVIHDFSSGEGTEDLIELQNIAGFTEFADVLDKAVDQGVDTLITLDAENSILIKDVNVNDLHQDDFRFA